MSILENISYIIKSGCYDRKTLILITCIQCSHVTLIALVVRSMEHLPIFATKVEYHNRSVFSVLISGKRWAIPLNTLDSIETIKLTVNYKVRLENPLSLLLSEVEKLLQNDWFS
jgi:hypothetical protein